MPMDWMGLKGLASDLGLAKDALHVYAAVAIQIAAALLFRRSLANWLPWFAVLLVEVLNEGGDMWFGEEAHIQQWQIDGAKHDLLNTMVLPTVLLVLARYVPSLFTARPPRLPDPADEAEEVPNGQ
jgi:hypothetical protein